MNGDGQPLVRETEQSRSDIIGALFAKTRKGAEVQATFSNLRDTSATHVERLSRTGTGPIDKALVSLFLGHGDDRTASYYIDNDPETMETTKLDAVIDQLATIYDLRLEDQPAETNEPAETPSTD